MAETQHQRRVQKTEHTHSHTRKAVQAGTNLWKCCSFPWPGRHRHRQQALLGRFACHCRTWCASVWTAGNLHRWGLLFQWRAASAAWGSHNSYLGNKEDISMLEKGTRPNRETEGNETRSKCGIKKINKKTGRGSIKSNPTLRAGMDHHISTSGRNKQLVFWGQSLKKVICFLCRQGERPN